MTKSHLYDPRIQTHRIVWHNDPNLEFFIRHIINNTKPDRFVETGTHMGWTSMWVGSNYPSLPISTVEVDDQYFHLSSENLSEYPQVSVTHGSSPDFLRSLLPLLRDGLPMFWLDAHWWPPVPLREECKIVASLDRYICILDDFYCSNPDFEGDTFDGSRQNRLDYVSDVLGPRCFRPAYPSQPGYKGYGLFAKGVDYTVPGTMKEDVLSDSHV